MMVWCQAWGTRLLYIENGSHRPEHHTRVKESDLTNYTVFTLFYPFTRSFPCFSGDPHIDKALWLQPGQRHRKLIVEVRLLMKYLLKYFQLHLRDMTIWDMNSILYMTRSNRMAFIVLFVQLNFYLLNLVFSLFHNIICRYSQSLILRTQKLRVVPVSV